MLRSNVKRGEDVHDLAVALIQQAERCERAGLIQQAIAILTQAWTIGRAEHTTLADRAAWQIAWLDMRLAAYADAAIWFERVGTPPPIDQQWSEMRASLVRVCRDSHDGSADSNSLAIAAPSPLAPLRVISLGRFAVERDGAALPPCNARKAITIFRYLLTRRYHTAAKEELMELLWPEAAPERAAHNLQMAISALRRFLDTGTPSYIVWDAGSYRLHADATIDDDSGAFSRLCDAADHAWRAGQIDQALAGYTVAIERYTGDYHIDDADAVWAIAERERLLTRYLVALERLGDLHHQHTAYEAAIGCYRRVLERDPYREDVACQIMRCFVQLGRRGDALRQFQRTADVLRTDLGLDPSPETAALHSTIAGAA